MKILNSNNQEIQNPDLTLGYLKDDKILVQHHNAIPYNPGKWHYITIKEYPNGGKDVEKFYEESEVQAQEAWDEYEDIQRYVLYTAEELEKKKQEEEAESQKQEQELKLMNDIRLLKERVLELEKLSAQKGG